MSTIVLTVNDLSERQGVDYQTASGLIRFLREKGFAKEGKTRPTGGRGRGAQEYILPEKIEIDLSLIVEKTEKVEVVETVAAVAETVVPTAVETAEVPVAVDPVGTPLPGDDLMNDDDLIAA